MFEKSFEMLRSYREVSNTLNNQYSAQRKEIFENYTGAMLTEKMAELKERDLSAREEFKQSAKSVFDSEIAEARDKVNQIVNETLESVPLKLFENIGSDLSKDEVNAIFNNYSGNYLMARALFNIVKPEKQRLILVDDINRYINSLETAFNKCITFNDPNMNYSYRMVVDGNVFGEIIAVIESFTNRQFIRTVDDTMPKVDIVEALGLAERLFR